MSRPLDNDTERMPTRGITTPRPKALTSLKDVERITSGVCDITESEDAHPTIKDYYMSAAHHGMKNVPVAYQHGLSNYSNVTLGDERVSYKKSMTQEVFTEFKSEEELAEAANAPLLITSMHKTRAQRIRDYAEATAIVGIENVGRMESQMRDKLQQRTKAGPFQLRKTFKYFDRDGSGAIDDMEFKRALELMGFQFNDVQIQALFARYDESQNGEVDYQEFVDRLMEADFTGLANSVTGRKLSSMIEAFSSDNHNVTTIDGVDVDADDDDDEEERKFYQMSEVQKIFRMIDKDNSGEIDRSEFKLLLMALGKTNIEDDAIDEAMLVLDHDGSGFIEFKEFYSWWVTHK